MRSPLILSLALTFLTSLSHAISTPSSTSRREVSILAWPLLTTTPQPLAHISYTPTNASIESYTAISIPSNAEIVRIGFHHPSGAWSGIATSATNLAKDVSKTLTLHVRPDGEIYHVGWKVDGAEPVGGKWKGGSIAEAWKLNVEVEMIKEGPTPALNKPVVISADGEEAKEPEKSFLQK